MQTVYTKSVRLPVTANQTLCVLPERKMNMKLKTQSAQWGFLKIARPTPIRSAQPSSIRASA